MKQKKICVVTGNRADYSRLKSVLRAIRAHPRLRLTLFAIASHLLPDAGETIQDLRRDGFRIDAVARTVIEGEDTTAMAKSVGLGVLELPTLLGIHRPDIVVIVGDRFEILSVAVAAALMNIPLAHIQGGEVTGSIDESIRHAITKFAHLHFPATRASAARIIKMGEQRSRVFAVGCPSVDILDAVDFRQDLHARYHLIPGERFLLVAQHPVTTEFHDVRRQIRETLEAVAVLRMKTIFLFPNIDAGSKDMVAEIRRFDRGHALDELVYKYKHIVNEDFLWLLRRAACMVGNSSAGIREAGYFGTPVVNIGSRQAGRERGRHVRDVSHHMADIVRAVRRQCAVGRYPVQRLYGAPGAGRRIADILARQPAIPVQKRIGY